MPEAFSKQRLLLFCAIIAALAAGLAVVTFWFVWRNRQPAAAHAGASAAPANAANGSSPFPGLRESDVPGRYRWFHAGIDGGTIQLNADHTFVNKDGKTLPKYRWEIAPDGLRIIWQSGQISRFPVMERPGVFVFLRPNGGDSRLEKIEGNSK
jgi:hypothetical protein